MFITFVEKMIKPCPRRGPRVDKEIVPIRPSKMRRCRLNEKIKIRLIVILVLLLSIFSVVALFRAKQYLTMLMVLMFGVMQFPRLASGLFMKTDDSMNANTKRQIKMKKIGAYCCLVVVLLSALMGFALWNVPD